MKRTKFIGVQENLTPTEAVKRFCFQCVEKPPEVEHCGGDELVNGKGCPLFLYRRGNRRTPVGVIRHSCLDCHGGCRDEVLKCPKKVCPLWPYRLGTNPNREGVGGPKQGL